MNGIVRYGETHSVKSWHGRLLSFETGLLSGPFMFSTPIANVRLSPVPVLAERQLIYHLNHARCKNRIDEVFRRHYENRF